MKNELYFMLDPVRLPLQRLAGIFPKEIGRKAALSELEALVWLAYNAGFSSEDGCNSDDLNDVPFTVVVSFRDLQKTWHWDRRKVIKFIATCERFGLMEMETHNRQKFVLKLKYLMPNSSLFIDDRLTHNLSIEMIPNKTQNDNPRNTNQENKKEIHCNYFLLLGYSIVQCLLGECWDKFFDEEDIQIIAKSLSQIYEKYGKEQDLFYTKISTTITNLLKTGSSFRNEDIKQTLIHQLSNSLDDL